MLCMCEEKRGAIMGRSGAECKKQCEIGSERLQPILYERKVCQCPASQRTDDAHERGIELLHA